MKEVSAIAPIRDGKILCGKRRDNNLYTQPGGHLEKGENPVQGARRELLEETGIDMPESSFKHTESRIINIGKGKQLKVHGFICEIPEGVNTSMKEDPDNEVYRWFWTKYPLSKEIVDNHHVKPENNVTLPYLEEVKKAFYVGFEKAGDHKLSIKRNGKLYDLTKEEGEDIRRLAKNTLLGLGAGAAAGGTAGYLASKIPTNKTPAKVIGSILGASIVSPFTAMYSVGKTKTPALNKLNERIKSIDKTASEKIKGGKASGFHPDQFDDEFLRDGERVEMEHTNNKQTAREIAMDHGVETGKVKADGKIHSKYYDFLSSFENKVKKHA